MSFQHLGIAAVPEDTEIILFMLHPFGQDALVLKNGRAEAEW